MQKSRKRHHKLNPFELFQKFLHTSGGITIFQYLLEGFYIKQSNSNNNYLET